MTTEQRIAYIVNLRREDARIDLPPLLQVSWADFVY